MRAILAGSAGVIAGLTVGLSSAYWGLPFHPESIPWKEITANVLGAAVGGGIAVGLAMATFRQERQAALADEARRNLENARRNAWFQLAEGYIICDALAAIAEATTANFKLKRDNLEYAIKGACGALIGVNISAARAREVVAQAVDRAEAAIRALEKAYDDYLGAVGADAPIPTVAEIAGSARAQIMAELDRCLENLAQSEVH